MEIRTPIEEVIRNASFFVMLGAHRASREHIDHTGNTMRETGGTWEMYLAADWGDEQALLDPLR
eukprot:1236310-Alexandrium_andersonii.AAC.1